ncbi:acyltransferase [Desulfoluna sp.]|uniref:acyltransferase n=1 Tax=Desulfoluna sp. TaxID=2045199 RepID=UPI002604D79F|nr:acyltransferase [Desulfoluna sp.]
MKQPLVTITLRIVSRLFRLLHPMNRAFRRLVYTARFMAHVKKADPSTQCDGPIRILGTGQITLGKRCRLGRECEFTTEEQGEIILGSNIRINRGVTLTSYAQIRIGTFSIVGEFTSIRDANHGMEMGTPMRLQAHTCAPITIGRDVWIGRGSCILPGVTIGDGAIIGANSVVTKDIPSHTLAAGAPARMIRKREKPSS